MLQKPPGGITSTWNIRPKSWRYGVPKSLQEELIIRYRDPGEAF
jgi:hypothetical protein